MRSLFTKCKKNRQHGKGRFHKLDSGRPVDLAIQIALKTTVVRHPPHCRTIIIHRIAQE